KDRLAVLVPPLFLVIADDQNLSCRRARREPGNQAADYDRDGCKSPEPRCNHFPPPRHFPLHYVPRRPAALLCCSDPVRATSRLDCPLPCRDQHRAAPARETGAILSHAFDDLPAAERHRFSPAISVDRAGGAAP